LKIQREYRKEYPIDQSNESTVSCSVKDVKYRSRHTTVLAALHC